MNDYLTFLGFCGGLVLFYWCVIGGMVSLRWGFVGWQFIWGRRKELDAHVREDIQITEGVKICEITGNS